MEMLFTGPVIEHDTRGRAQREVHVVCHQAVSVDLERFIYSLGNHNYFAFGAFSACLFL